MRKILLASFIFLAFASCRKVAKVAQPDQWADYRKGYSWLSKRQDSAFFFFNRAASNAAAKDVVALAYYNMALIQVSAGDNYGAQESLTLSLKSLDEQQPNGRNYMATDYNELGLTCENLNENRDALNYYRLALRYADDKNLRPYILNDLGNACSKLGFYNQALTNYQAAISMGGYAGAIYAKTLTNLAVSRWRRDHHYNAAPELVKSLLIRLKEHDKWGENSSYAHLADFYKDRRPDSALFYAGKMYAVAGSLQSPDDELEALQKLIVLSPPTDVKTYFNRYQTLGDSLVKSRNAAKNQFALIRYNVEKSKAENLQLQKENAAKRYQLGGVLIVVVLGSILAVFWYRKRKQRLQLEAENTIKQNQLTVSQRVHDVVSNGLHRVMSEIENQDKLEKDTLLDQIEMLYEQSRDISYERPGIPNQDFRGKIARLLTSFAGPAIKIALAGNNSEVWEKVGAPAREQLGLILQELMVNMKKHSQATNVAVLFTLEGRNFHMDYVDNGIGFAANTTYGNGLTNTGNRIQHMGGTITFDTQPGKGTKIHIAVPLNN